MLVAIAIAAFVCLIVLPPLIGGVYFSPERRRLAARRPLEQRAATAVADLRQGETAKIRGVVVAREPLVRSAIGGEACVGYRAIIEEPRDTWAMPILSREEWPSFVVKDDTGSVVVQGPFEMLIDASDGAMELTPRGYELLKEQDERMNDVWGPRRFVFRETRLRAGDHVSLIGRPSRGIDPAGPWEMRGTWDEPVVVADDYEQVRALPAGTPSAPPLLLEAPAGHGPSRREIDRRAITAIAALRGGVPARIQGVAAAREPLLASPVGGRDCIGYRVIIERMAHSWSPVVRREAWPSFRVTDDTGTAVVEGPFWILLDPDDGGWATLPPGVYALLEEAKVPIGDLLGRDWQFRFKETLLQVGDRVSVVGRPSLEIDPAGQGSFREPPRLHVMRGSDKEPVAIIDVEDPVDDEPLPS